MKYLFIIIITLFWTTHNFKYLAEAIIFMNTLPDTATAQVVSLNHIDEDLDAGNFAHYAVIYKEEVK